ncbi:MAG: hypothetical protein H0W72_03830 [Planctomycetes bacterium]|nr:hypothetical protein [Planctomycetota bacterium]
MSDAVPAQPVAPAAAPPAKAGFAFTDPGCRTEVRVGALLVLMGLFLWLWLGPSTSIKLCWTGLPLVVIGVPIQAIQARRDGRPGFPWKLGLTLAIGSLLMWNDLTYREAVAGQLFVQPIAPILLGVGMWILAWWPIARTGRKGRAT